jgi:inorganic pyrophosphatase
VPRSDEELIVVVIETPKVSRNKYAYDVKEHIFELKKVYRPGWRFPTTLASCHPPAAVMGIRSMSSC